MRSKREKTVRICLLGCLILLTQSVSAEAEMPKIAGIWYSSETNSKLSIAHKDQLVCSLRRITGLNELCFEEDGSVSLGHVEAARSGSLLARQILLYALNSGKMFIIEDHSGSLDVNFGQMDEGTKYENVMSQQRLDIWRVRLDFEDFRAMSAPLEVRAAFDPGFTLLHELLHGLGYKDAENIKEIGECEEQINRTRAELGLPQRDQYFGEPLQITPNITTVRLRFRSEEKNRRQASERFSRRRWHYLFFLLPIGSKVSPSQNGLVMLDCRSKN